MKKIIHPIAGTIALILIASFWLSTVVSELSGSVVFVTTVKSTVPWGFLLLIPALAAAGGSGFALAQGGCGGLIGTKVKRMPFIAANGILVLIPAALFLAAKARAGEFDATFYTIQVLELFAGATNITLLGLNMRDGLKLTGKLRTRGAVTSNVKLIGRDTVAEGTMAFRFSVPSGFTYKAGQHISLTLISPTETDAEGNSRKFTVASAPHEPEIMVVTRMRDTAFKRTLKNLPIGTTLSMTGPVGDMTLHADATRPAIFIAGGIGITPFLAMLRHAANVHLANPITLFYSNRRPEDSAFLSELRSLKNSNTNFYLVATMTSMHDSKQVWKGETGYINEAMLRHHLPDLLTPIYYIAGPTAMVAGVKEMLAKIGVSQQDIRFEEFYGY